MNTNFKILAIATLLGLSSTASFGQTSLSALSAAFTAAGVDLTAVKTGISAADPAAYTPYTTTPAAKGDLAVIDQASGTLTTGSDAYINQSNAAGTTFNIASITQVDDVNKAYIDQGGEGNVALIYQFSSGNFAYISQTSSTKGMAGIDQANLLHPSMAYINQVGTAHSALIVQK